MVFSEICTGKVRQVGEQFWGDLWLPCTWPLGDYEMIKAECVLSPGVNRPERRGTPLDWVARISKVCALLSLRTVYLQQSVSFHTKVSSMLGNLQA